MPQQYFHMQHQQFQKLYDELRPFYRLLYIYDIEEYSPADLKSLANRLLAQLILDQNEKKIHDQLIAKSKRNIEKKLQQKRLREEQKKEMKMKEKGKIINQGHSKINKKQEKVVLPKQQEEEEDYIDQSCIIEDQQMENAVYSEKKSVEGKVYDGRLLIQLNIAIPSKKGERKVLFEIISEEQDSKIARQALKLLSFNSNAQQVELIVEGHKTRLKLTEKGINTIGFKYLRANNVVNRYNFRPENMTFSMIFTQ